jgi:hypothetical protein
MLKNVFEYFNKDFFLFFKNRLLKDLKNRGYD